MSPKTSRLDPRLVRQVLEYAETHGPVITARKFGIHHSSVYRWQGYRTERGEFWPTNKDIAEWDAKAKERRLNAARKRQYNARRYLNRGPVLSDATGTIRRVRALAAIGHSQSEMAVELNLSPERVSQIARGAAQRVFPETVQAVNAMYRRLAGKPRTGKRALYVMTYAKQKGWASPMAWDDNTIDDPKARPRGIAGSRPRRNPSQVAA